MIRWQSASILACAAMVSLGCTGPGEGSGAGGAGAAAAGDGESEWTTLASFRQARTVVERGLEALGGRDAIAEAGGLALEGEGELDLGTLLQGRTPFEGDPHPIRERIAILPGEDRLVHELRAPLNPDAEDWRRTDYRTAGTYRMNLQTARAAWTPPAERTRVERTIPHLLLAEILAAPTGLRYLGERRLESGPREAVSWLVPDRGLVTLLFDPSTGHLREVEALADVPVRGDTPWRWSFTGYEEVEGLGPFPTGYTIEVDGERLQEVRWTHRTTSPTGGVLDAPAEIELPEPTPFAAQEGGGGGGGPPGEEDEFDIRDLAPGVHLLVNLRLGFHMLFVELDDGVLAVDAPAGWWELQELPPRNWAGLASPALGERYVAAIRSRIPDKPIRWVVLTHHHGDHMGGVEAFVEAGATVLGPPDTRAVVERTLEGTLELAGARESESPGLEWTPVEGEVEVGEGERRVRIVDVGPNPHTDQMLAVWLPETRILYVSDLFDPWGSQGRPSVQRTPIMRWFTGWLDESGLEPDRIYAVHGAARVTEEHLEEMRSGGENGGG